MKGDRQKRDKVVPNIETKQRIAISQVVKSLYKKKSIA
jgi:hypothetical protein